MEFIVLLLCATSGILGSPTDWRIVGGEAASENQFPYQVSLRYAGMHTCGGSILDASTIITAAHCVEGRNPSYLTVRVGSNFLTEQTESYKVISFIRHEDYNAYKIINDIAIIKLKDSIRFHDGVQPIELPQNDIDNGASVTLSGWGKNNYPGSVPNDLQWIKLKTISVKQCADAHNLHGLQVYDTEVCTFTKEGEGACHGDSGGPLVNDNVELIGIVSWGYPCARGFPDVFTRVYSYLGWIEKNRK